MKNMSLTMVGSYIWLNIFVNQNLGRQRGTRPDSGSVDVTAGRFSFLGFYMCGSSHPTTYLPMDAVYPGRVLKKPRQLSSMESSNNATHQCYYDNLWDKYLKRPAALHSFTYPEMIANFRWDTTASPRFFDESDIVDLPDSTGRSFPRILFPNNVMQRYLAGDSQAKGGWRVRQKICVPYWNFIAPVDHPSIERYYMQQLMLHVPYTHSDVLGQGHMQLTKAYLISAHNDTGTYLEEAIIQLGDDAQIDGLSMVTNAAIRGIGIQKLRDWVPFLAERGWLDEDDALEMIDTIADLRDQYEQNYMEVADGDVIDDYTTSECDQVATAPSIPFEDLTNSQQRAYCYLHTQLQKGHTIKAAIIGEAGTGKSFLIPPLIRMFAKRGLNVAIMAPTGIAAWTIGGTTIHRRFQINEDDQVCLSQGSAPWTALKNADVIFIDELSMLSWKHLENIQRGCKRVMKRAVSDVEWQTDFAGKHLLLFGDPGQLQPIGKSIYNHPIFGRMDCLVLTDILRQKDHRFTRFLQRIRLGQPSDEDFQWCRHQRVRLQDIDLDKTTIIVATNREHDDINNEVAAGLVHDHVLHVLDAQDTGNFGQPMPEGIRQARIKAAKKRHVLWPEQLRIWKGARVMLLANQNVPAGEVNGMLGTVIDYKNNVIIVRNKANGRLCPVFRRSQRCGGHTNLMVRKQFPLALAYAVTCHKIQGQTLERVAVKLNSGFKQLGQLYVALSRVRNQRDISFIQLDEQYISKPFPEGFFEKFQDNDKLRTVTQQDVRQMLRDIANSHRHRRRP